MNKTLSTTAVIGLVLMTTVAAPLAAATKDREQIIDVAKITKAVRQSTKPLYKALEKTQLKQRFQTVQKLLAAGKVDKDELLKSLKQLQGSIDQFTGRWESVVDPLWAGQETLGKAIASIRRKVPAEGVGEVPARIQKLLTTYDKRLRELAQRIGRTKDPVARKRLKRMFQNLLSLRQFTEKLGRAGIERVKVKLMLRTVQVLARLQDQLMDATFELEKVRSILASESQFIGDYVELLEMSRDATDLVAMLRQLRQEGQAIGGVSADAGKVQRISDEVAKGLQGFSKNILDDLEKELDKMAEEMGEPGTAAPSATVDADLDAEITRYSTWTVVEQRIIVE